MNGLDRQQAANAEALSRLQEAAHIERRRARSAVERIAEAVTKILGGNTPPATVEEDRQ